MLLVLIIPDLRDHFLNDLSIDDCGLRLQVLQLLHPVDVGGSSRRFASGDICRFLCVHFHSLVDGLLTIEFGLLDVCILCRKVVLGFSLSLLILLIRKVMREIIVIIILLLLGCHFTHCALLFVHRSLPINLDLFDIFVMTSEAIRLT